MTNVSAVAVAFPTEAIMKHYGLTHLEVFLLLPRSEREFLLLLATKRILWLWGRELFESRFLENGCLSQLFTAALHCGCYYNVYILLLDKH